MPHTVRFRTTRVHLQLEALEARTTPSSSAYVRGLYLNLLGRDAAPEEVSAWVTTLNRTGDPAQVAQGIAGSTEFQTNLVRLNYAALLGRAPAPAELDAWLGQLQGGLSEAGLQTAVLASAEYLARAGGTDAAWLAAAYRDVLGRPADPNGRAAWLGRLQEGADRQAVAAQLVGSAEARTRVVATTFRQLLDRAPDPAGQAFWAGRLGAGLPLSGLVAAVAVSAEYIDRTSAGGLDLTPVIAAAFSETGLRGQGEAQPRLSARVGSQVVRPSESAAARGGTLAIDRSRDVPPGTGLPVFNPVDVFARGRSIPGFNLTALNLTAGVNPLGPFFSFLNGSLPSTDFSPLAVPALGSNTFLALVIPITSPSPGLPGDPTAVSQERAISARRQ